MKALHPILNPQLCLPPPVRAYADIEKTDHDGFIRRLFRMTPSGLIECHNAVRMAIDYIERWGLWEDYTGLRETKRLIEWEGWERYITQVQTRQRVAKQCAWTRKIRAAVKRAQYREEHAL